MKINRDEYTPLEPVKTSCLEDGYSKIKDEAEEYCSQIGPVYRSWNTCCIAQFLAQLPNVASVFGNALATGLCVEKDDEDSFQFQLKAKKWCLLAGAGYTLLTIGCTLIEERCHKNDSLNEIKRKEHCANITGILIATLLVVTNIVIFSISLHHCEN